MQHARVARFRRFSFSQELLDEWERIVATGEPGRLAEKFELAENYDGLFTAYRMQLQVLRERDSTLAERFEKLARVSALWPRPSTMPK